MSGVKGSQDLWSGGLEGGRGEPVTRPLVSSGVSVQASDSRVGITMVSISCPSIHSSIGLSISDLAQYNRFSPVKKELDWMFFFRD